MTSWLQEDSPPSGRPPVCIQARRRRKDCCIWPFDQKSKDFPETYQQNSIYVSFAKYGTWPPLDAAEDWKASIPTTRGVSIKEAVWQLLWGLLTANGCIWQNSYFFFFTCVWFFSPPLPLFVYVFNSQYVLEIFCKCVYIALSNSAWYSTGYVHDDFCFCWETSRLLLNLPISNNAAVNSLYKFPGGTRDGIILGLLQGQLSKDKCF